TNNHYEKLWHEKFNALCYEVFFKNEFGKELLTHLENRYFRSPVAIPGKEPAWAYFNEGRNELIRSFTVAIQQHIAKPELKKKTTDRRQKIKPIPNER